MKLLFKIKWPLYVCCGMMLILATGCKKFLDIPSPKDQIQTAEIFRNDQAATSAITGLYSFMLTSPLWPSNGGMSVFPGLSADEIYPITPNTEILEFSNNNLRPANGNLNGVLWSHAYRTIYHANAILEGLSNSTELSEPVKRQLRGEALLVRALHFFYLSNLYGKVPLTTTTNYDVNKSMPRTELQEINQQIINDLGEAKSVLNAQYPTAGRVRPNKWAATALLARTYLYLGEWQKAEAEATEIINSGNYSLVANLDNVFTANSDETIWSLRQEKTNTSEGQTFIPIFSFFAPNYNISSSLLNAFESADQRKNKWIASNTVSGQTYYYPYKYRKGYDFSSPTPPVSEFYIVFRLAEQYLIRAEARTKQNNISGAQSDLNLIRSRAGLNSTTASDIPSLLSAIEQERRVELFAEWGHRWFDLKRWKRAITVLSAVKAPNWQNTDTLYPIPFAQIQANSFLTQNEGY